MKSMRPSSEMSRYKAKSLAIATYVSVQKCQIVSVSD